MVDNLKQKMINTSPLVSVVIATYRRDQTLKVALQSLAIQVYDNFEVILVDDNGNEEWNQKVKMIINEITTDYPKLKITMIVNSLNEGSARARNEGVFSAKGKYITFLDDDDKYLPEKIEKQIACITATDADFCITDLYLYNENDTRIDVRIRNYIKQIDQESLLTYHLKYNMTGTDTLMFRASFIHDIGGFYPIDVGDEFYLVLNAIISNGKIAYLPRCDVKAYVHNKNGGLSTCESKIKGENILWEHKKKYYNQLNNSDIKYINMRHYVVIAIIHKNQRRYVALFRNLLKAFLMSPIGIIKLFFAHKGII